MKLIQITYHFEFTDAVEAILDRRGVRHFVRYPMLEGMDRDGRHYGSKVFPGSSSVVQALTADDEVEPLLAELKAFKEGEESHRHLTAVVLPVETELV